MRPDEIGNKIVEDIVNENNKEVYLVAGLINATGKVLHWRTRAEIKLGDYAIVENMNDYDLVKIVGTVITTEKVIGIVKTTKKDTGKFSNTKYENMKNAILGINANIIEDNNIEQA